jgi:hypothetical protein
MMMKGGGGIHLGFANWQLVYKQQKEFIKVTKFFVF